MKVASFISKNKLFISGYILVVLVFGALCFIVPKGNENIWFDLRRTKIGDIAFANYTHLGDGLSGVLLSIILACFVNYKRGLQLLMAFSISGIAAQIVKKFVAGPVPRPSLFLKENFIIKGVDGVELLQYFSFPSGHTTTFFAVCSFFALWLHSKYSPLWLVPAILGALSRIYLAQHFLIDIFAGACLGGFTTFIIYYSSENWVWINKPAFQKRVLKR